MKFDTVSKDVQGVARKHMPVCLGIVVVTAAAVVGACAQEDDAFNSPDSGMNAVDSSSLPDAADVVETDTEPVRTPFVAANSLPEGDPRKQGETYFLYSTWGTGVVAGLPPAEFLVQLQTSEPDVFGNQFAAFGFVPDPSRDLPVGLGTDGETGQNVAQTCGLCHVAELPDGRIWLGAPNPDLRWGDFRVAIEDRWVAAGNSPTLTALDREKLLLQGPGRTGAESGEYPRLVPADFPVYYELGTRNDLNYMGTGRNITTEVSFSLYAAGCGNPDEETAVVPWPEQSAFDAFVAYMAEIEPPDAPAQDTALVQRGEEVFTEARCNTCHFPNAPVDEFVVPVDRTEGATERYPGDDPEWPRGSIRTSTAHRILQDGDGEGGGTDDRVGELIAFILSRGLQIQQTDGYRTNSLRGLWASAPYLHNGSVPTLEDLLKPAAERPARWMQGEFEVDTTRFGFDNSGHEFGTDLSADDKEALLAFLRSL